MASASPHRGKLSNECAAPPPPHPPISRGFPATEEPSPVLLIKTHLFKLKVFFQNGLSFGISIQDKLFFQILQNPESRSQGVCFSSIVLYYHVDWYHFLKHCQRFYYKETWTSQYTYKYVWEQGSG